MDANIFPYLVELVITGRSDIQREGCWAICNAICGGNPQQVYCLMIMNGLIDAICKLIRNGEDVKLLSIILESLDRCIIMGDMIKSQSNSESNFVKIELDECGCLDALEGLTVADENFYRQLDTFIEKHFGYADDLAVVM